MTGTGEQNWGSGDWFQGERRLLIGLVLSGNRPEGQGPISSDRGLTLPQVSQLESSGPTESHARAAIGRYAIRPH